MEECCDQIHLVRGSFARKAAKNKWFICPISLWTKEVNVTHPKIKILFQLDILGV